MKDVAYNLTPSAVTISYNGEFKVYSSDSSEYPRIKELIKLDDEEGLVALLTEFKNKVEQSSPTGQFKVRDGLVYVGDDALPRTLGERLVQFSDEGLPVEPIMKFWERLSNNPSRTVVQRLFECLEKHHHPICPDGRFLAYKRVKSDFKDFYSGKFDNSPGKTVSVPRNRVDDDHDIECSNGLHLSSYDYAKYSYNSGSGLLVEVIVDPQDIVTVCKDYDFQKFRTCKYEVIKVCEEERKEQLYNYNHFEEVCPDCDLELSDCVCDEEDLD